MILLCAALLCLCAAGMAECPVSEALASEPAFSETLVSKAAVLEPLFPEAAVLEPLVLEAAVPEAPVSEDLVSEFPVSEDAMPEDAMPEDAIPEDTIPENTIPEDATPEDTMPEDTIPEDTIPEDATPENAMPEDTIPEDATPEDTMPEDAMPEDVTPEDPVHDESHSTEERVRASYAEKTGSMETHAWITEYDLYCEDCEQVIQENVRTEVTLQPHEWFVTQEEPTCTEPGRAVRQCAICGEEDVIETPAVGHCYMWMDVKLPNGDVVSRYVCTVCGDVAQQRKKTASQMYYNSTITSFGPMVRDLIGGGVWNRVTPLDLEEEGMFTFPLIAGNEYTVGTATVINEEGTQVISYKLNADSITVHTETLVIYPSLEALRTGENAVTVEFNQPVEIEQYFGDDQIVLMAITLKADFDPQDAGIQGFREDTALINDLSRLID